MDWIRLDGDIDGVFELEYPFCNSFKYFPQNNHFAVPPSERPVFLSVQELLVLYSRKNLI